MRGRPYGLAKKEKGERYGKTGNSGEESEVFRRRANRVYRLARRRNTSHLVTLLISLAFLIWNLVKFFQMA